MGSGWGWGLARKARVQSMGHPADLGADDSGAASSRGRVAGAAKQAHVAPPTADGAGGGMQQRRAVPAVEHVLSGRGRQDGLGLSVEQMPSCAA